MKKIAHYNLEKNGLPQCLSLGENCVPFAVSPGSCNFITLRVIEDPAEEKNRPRYFIVLQVTSELPVSMANPAGRLYIGSWAEYNVFEMLPPVAQSRPKYGRPSLHRWDVEAEMFVPVNFSDPAKNLKEVESITQELNRIKAEGEKQTGEFISLAEEARRLGDDVAKLQPKKSEHPDGSISPSFEDVAARQMEWIVDLEKKITQREGEILSLLEKVGTRDDRIKELEADLKQNTALAMDNASIVDKLKLELSALNDQLNRQNDQIFAQAETIRKKNELLQMKAEETDSLKKRIKDLEEENQRVLVALEEKHKQFEREKEETHNLTQALVKMTHAKNEWEERSKDYTVARADVNLLAEILAQKINHVNNLKK